MEPHEEWVDMVTECRRIIEQGIEALDELDYQLRGEESIEPASLHSLYDMAEDAAVSGRIRRAEANLAWRHAAPDRL